MGTCPYCGAETRPGDNFCLNCGHRLLVATPSSQQAQSASSEPTIPAQDNWRQAILDQDEGTVAASPNVGGWSEPTIMGAAGMNAAELPTIRGDAQASIGVAAPPPVVPVENPAKFILRADNGDVLHEYPLEKPEISIGRAPNSDILLSKDKLTSRRHATVRNENGSYILRDGGSANGTFVNGQQLEDSGLRILQDGDHVGIGEHELIFRSGDQISSTLSGVEDLPTIAVPFEAMQDLTYRTREDEMSTNPPANDYETRTMDGPSVISAPSSSPFNPLAPEMPESEEVSPAPVPSFMSGTAAPAAPVSPNSQSSGQSASSSSQPVPKSPSMMPESGVSFNRLTSILQPSLPDIAPLMAALSALDGQVASLQDQLIATQEAMQNHESEIAQTTNQLRSGVRSVSDHMDSTIADVARSREALAWAELLQLMEDVMNNPRDIEYVTKLARKARELNKVFQLHQSVLNTLAECNSLLRSLIGEDK